MNDGQATKQIPPLEDIIPYLQFRFVAGSNSHGEARDAFEQAFQDAVRFYRVVGGNTPIVKIQVLYDGEPCIETPVSVRDLMDYATSQDP